MKNKIKQKMNLNTIKIFKIFKHSYSRMNLNKKAFEINMFAWWVIGLGVLVISFLGYLILSGKLQGAVGYIKNIFRFGVGQ